MSDALVYRYVFKEPGRMYSRLMEIKLTFNIWGIYREIDSNSLSYK